MILYDTLQPEDQVYDLVITGNTDPNGPYFRMVADCKDRKHVNEHGAKYHYTKLIAEASHRIELLTLKSILEKYRKA